MSLRKAGPCVLPVLLVLLVLLAASAVYAQTFQYSRGWTNGKRSDDSQKRLDKMGGILERIVDNPCQLGKLKYLLEGKPITEKIFMPCDYQSDEEQSSDTKRPPYFKNQRTTQDQIFDNFL